MSRRCKPGQRARVVGSNWNKGQVVLVVRYYFGEDIDGAKWPEAIFPWVVASLGAPLRRMCLTTRKETPAKMLAVMDDCDLQPLDDNDDGLNESADTDRPVERPKPVKV